jgi:membrane protease YdiL (CAAX protease family)
VGPQRASVPLGHRVGRDRVLLSIVPLINLVGLIRSHQTPFRPADAVWLAAAVMGAWTAAYAIRSFTRETFLQLWICLATAGLAGCAIMTALAFLNGTTNQPLGSRVLTGLSTLALYIPVQFFVEEVWFRGILDSHLHRPGENRGVLSAIYGSALWGVWHYPISDSKDLVNLLITIGISVAVGTLLARAWRRSGNLLVPVIAHALIDAFGSAIAG